MEAIGNVGTGAEIVVSPVVGRNLRRLRFTNSKFCSHGNGSGTFYEISTLHRMVSPLIVRFDPGRVG
jgi:hypothetical protein